MTFFAIIIVEHVSKERLSFKMLKSIVAIDVVLLKNHFNVLEPLFTMLQFTLFEALLVLVEYVSHH